MEWPDVGVQGSLGCGAKKRERKKMNSVFRGNGSRMCPWPAVRPAAPRPASLLWSPGLRGTGADESPWRAGVRWQAFLGTGWQGGQKRFPGRVGVASHLQPDTEMVQRWQERGRWA